MKRRTLLSAMPALGLGLVTNRVAADNRPKPLLLSSGGVNGTYYRLMKEFDATSPGLIINQELDGSLTNIDRIMDNQAELGITQFDVLDTRYKKETVLRDRIRILAQLHHEEIHFIAKSPPKIEGGVGAFGFTVGGRTVTLNTIDDLRDRKLAIWGGALITAQSIANTVRIGWTAIEYADQNQALEALKSDQVDAIMAVGGQPLPWVAELSRDYKLLDVPNALAAMLAGVFDKRTLTYRNLGQEGVPSIAVPAMLVTRNFASRSKHDQLQALRDRLIAVVADIRETRGTHPKWEEIDPAAVTDKWPMYLTADAQPQPKLSDLPLNRTY